MATDNRLTAHVPNQYVEQTQELADDRDINETDAERAIYKTGLEALGYRETPTDPADLLLHYARKIGSVLGFVGLILVGYGIFGSRLFSIVGFALLTAGFAFVASSELVPAVLDGRDAL